MSPTTMEVVDGLTAIDVREALGAVTVREVVREIPLKVAVIVTVPAPTPVASAGLLWPVV